MPLADMPPAGLTEFLQSAGWIVGIVAGLLTAIYFLLAIIRGRGTVNDHPATIGDIHNLRTEDALENAKLENRINDKINALETYTHANIHDHNGHLDHLRRAADLHPHTVKDLIQTAFQPLAQEVQMLRLAIVAIAEHLKIKVPHCDSALHDIGKHA